MLKKERVLIIAMTAVLAIAGLVGCSSQSVANAQEKKKEETEAIPVEVTTVEKGSISAYFTGTASLEAENEATVVAKVAGVVEKLLVEEGHRVRTNQVMAQLDDDKLALDLQEAQARLKQMENEYKRKKELFQKNIVSTEDYERARSDYEMQKAKVEQARLLKDYTSIRAPFAGVVAERMIKVGNMVPVHEACFRVTGFDPLLAVLHVPEKDLQKLRKDQPATLELDALPGKPYTGSILRISPVVDPKTGTFKVTVAVTGHKGALKPGMFSRIKVAYDVHDDTLLLPKDAVLTEGNESVVFVVNEKDKTVHRTVVKIGYINTTHLEIASGLKLGDIVVQTGIGGLKDGSRVEILAAAAQ